jgi:hypothetical protein
MPSNEERKRDQKIKDELLMIFLDSAQSFLSDGMDREESERAKAKAQLSV